MNVNTMEKIGNKQVNQTVLRGSKFKDYTVKESIDRPYYDGEIWNPNPNESLVGMYVDCLENTGKYNQSMYIIDTDRLDGKYDKIFGSTTLDRQMKKVNKSEIIEVTYLGKTEGYINSYHEYKVTRLRKQ